MQSFLWQSPKGYIYLLDLPMRVIDTRIPSFYPCMQNNGLEVWPCEMCEKLACFSAAPLAFALGAFHYASAH